MKFGISGKEGLSSDHFSCRRRKASELVKRTIEKGGKRREGESPTKDASDRPNINPSGIMSGTQQNLGCPIPEGDNLVGVALERNRERPPQT